MIRALLATAILAAAMLALAAPGNSEPSARQDLARDVAVLKRQVETLQRQVRTLTRDVRTLKAQNREQEDGILGVSALFVCSAAVTADTFAATWTVIDQLAQQTAAKTFFTPQPAVNDAGVCSELQVARPQPVPPTLSPFVSLLRFFQP